MNCSNQIQICAFSHSVCNFVGRESECPNCGKCSIGNSGPTVAEVMELYRHAIPARIKATGNDSLKKTLVVTERMVRRLLDVNGMDYSAPFSKINRNAMARLAQELKAEGLSAASVKSYLVSIQRIGALWVQRLCEEMGREIRPIPCQNWNRLAANTTRHRWTRSPPSRYGTTPLRRERGGVCTSTPC